MRPGDTAKPGRKMDSPRFAKLAAGPADHLALGQAIRGENRFQLPGLWRRQGGRRAGLTTFAAEGASLRGPAWREIRLGISTIAAYQQTGRASLNAIVATLADGQEFGLGQRPGRAHRQFPGRRYDTKKGTTT